MQSFYQFYQKRLQESYDNTNNLFIEAFDKANLDDVKITEGSGVNFYTFEDTVDGEKHYYKVSIVKNTTMRTEFDSQSYIYSSFSDKYNDLYSQFKTKYSDSWDVANISLKIDDRYGSSKLGNHNFVYSKMLACIQDAVSKHKPLFLLFSGYESAMDLVYDSLIKMSQRSYPQDAYVPYKMSYYIRKEVYDLIPNDDSLELAKKERERNLIDIRKQKNADRSSKLSPAQYLLDDL